MELQTACSASFQSIGLVQNLSGFFEEFLPYGKPLSFHSGDVLLSSSFPNSFFYIKDGLVAYYLSEYGGLNNYIGFNSLINEVFYFTPEEQRGKHVFLKDTKLYEFDLTFFEDKKIYNNTKLFYNIMKGISIKFFSLGKVMSLLNISNMEIRLMTFFYELYKFYQSEDILYPLNQQQVRELLRIGKTNMIRLVQNLKAKGWLEDFSYGHIRLRNIHAIAKAIERYPYSVT